MSICPDRLYHYGGVPVDADVDVLAYDDLEDAIDQIGATETTVVISSAQTVSTDETVPATMSLRFLRGGSLSISTGKTVTINGDIDAGLYQIFSGAGSVAFGLGTVKEAYPQWWGAKGDDATDDTTTIETALAIGIPIYFPTGTYLYGGNAEFTSDVRGNGRLTLIKFTAVNSRFTIASDKQRISHLNIVADAVLTVPCIEVLNYTGFWIIEDVLIYGSDVYDGIKVTSGLSGTIRDCRVDGASNNCIYITNVNPNWANAIAVENCRVRNAGAVGIMYENGVGGNILNCVSEGSSPKKILIKDSHSITITGFHQEGTSTIGLEIDGSNYIAVIGGYLSDTGTQLKLINASQSAYIAGVNFPETAATCIDIEAGVLDTIIRLGYIPPAKITDAGTRTSIFLSGGFDPGTGSVPGMRFSLEVGETGFSASSSTIVAMASGNLLGIFSGKGLWVPGISFGAPAALTIASGVITVTVGYHILTPQGGAGDDLDTINGGGDGMLLILKGDGTHQIDVKHNSGNILLSGAADYLLTSTTTRIILQYDAALTKWIELSRF